MQDAASAQEAAPSTNTNAETQAPETPQMPDLGLTVEQAAEWKNFIDNNGGPDKVMSKMKSITARKADTPVQPEPVQPAPQVEAPVQPQAPVRPAEGFITPQEMAMSLYNERLAQTKEYGGIKDEILSGSYLKEMASMGMTPVDASGNLNSKVIQQFLDLKAKTVPAPAPEVPMTNIPLKQYTEVEGDITSYEQALAIRKEGSGHPRYADAEQVIKNHFKPAQPEQK